MQLLKAEETRTPPRCPTAAPDMGLKRDKTSACPSTSLASPPGLWKGSNAWSPAGIFALFAAASSPELPPPQKSGEQIFRSPKRQLLCGLMSTAGSRQEPLLAEDAFH